MDGIGTLGLVERCLPGNACETVRAVLEPVRPRGEYLAPSALCDLAFVELPDNRIALGPERTNGRAYLGYNGAEVAACERDLIA